MSEPDRPPPQSHPQAPLALVTGAGKRVGRAICLALANAGCDLLIHYRSSEHEATTLANQVHALGRRAALWKLDLSNPESVATEAAALASRLPHLDILVHNASLYEPTPLTDVTLARQTAIHNTNALAPLLLSQAFAPHLTRSAHPALASIIAMLDIHAMGIPRAGFCAYAMSKAALHEMVRTLAKELAPRVRVNGVAPGVVAWPDAGYESDPASQHAYLARVPLGRAGTPEEAAEAVRWLALDATYTTGQVIRIDGGRSLL
jgi:pteridine reductase